MTTESELLVAQYFESYGVSASVVLGDMDAIMHMQAGPLDIYKRMLDRHGDRISIAGTDAHMAGAYIQWVGLSVMGGHMRAPALTDIAKIMAVIGDSAAVCDNPVCPDHGTPEARDVN